MNNERKTNITDKNKLRIPKFAIVFYCIAAFTLLVYVTAICSTSFANFFNRYISSFFRRILAYITNIFPFSLAEIMIILLPAALIFLIVFAVKKYSDTWRNVLKYIICIFSVLSLIFSSFVLTFGTGYYTSDFNERLELERTDVSADELYKTALILAEKINTEAGSISFTEKSSSNMLYSIREMNNKLLEAYRSLNEDYDFIPIMTTYVKPIILSEPMTYTHITGVYSYFTGEANLNTNSPDYTLPYTAAHELAHQRGIAREDEANFVAFLVCIRSDDPYIRYSGYLNLYEYVINALYSSDEKLYADAISQLDSKVIYEMIAYSEFFDKYRDNVVSDISGAINDVYLKSNNTEGTRSYGLVVDLAVSYYKSNK